MRIRIGGLHFHRPHHFVGLGLVGLGLLVVLWALPLVIWLALVGLWLAFIGWHLLRHHR